MIEKRKFYIDGAWVDPIDGKAHPVIDPSSEDACATISLGSDADTDAAVAAAKAAFPAWAATPVATRKAYVEKILHQFEKRRAEMAEAISLEMGAPMKLALGSQTRVMDWHMRNFLVAIEQIEWLKPHHTGGGDTMIAQEPIGVVGLITPWNFPIAIPAWKIAPALAYGNCVVLKPAELVPGCAWALAEIISRAGFPAGVFNLVMGSGRVVGDAMVNSPKVDGISFTGSVGVGRQIAVSCVSRQAKVQLEMGGKNPQIILDDADLKQAVELSVQSAFYSTGQRCTASSRFIVTAGIHDQFVAAMAERMKSIKVGHALKTGTDIGPVVSQAQLDQDLKYIDIGQSEGARLVSGGELVTCDTEGYFLAPTLFADSEAAMRISREEIFGPVANVVRVADYEAALAMANDTEFGLSAGIATTSLKYANHFKRHSQAGMVMVNLPTAGVDYHVPFGGRKGSSYGSREQGRYAQEFYTVVKTSYIGS